MSVSLFTLLLHHIFTTVWVKLGIFPHYSLYGSNLGSFNATVWSFHATVCMGQIWGLSTLQFGSNGGSFNTTVCMGQIWGLSTLQFGSNGGSFNTTVCMAQIWGLSTLQFVSWVRRGSFPRYSLCVGGGRGREHVHALCGEGGRAHVHACVRACLRLWETKMTLAAAATWQLYPGEVFHLQH